MKCEKDADKWKWDKADNRERLSERFKKNWTDEINYQDHKKNKVIIRFPLVPRKPVWFTLCRVTERKHWICLVNISLKYNTSKFIVAYEIIAYCNNILLILTAYGVVSHFCGNGGEILHFDTLVRICSDRSVYKVPVVIFISLKGPYRNRRHKTIYICRMKRRWASGISQRFRIGQRHIRIVFRQVILIHIKPVPVDFPCGSDNISACSGTKKVNILYPAPAAFNEPFL